MKNTEESVRIMRILANANRLRIVETLLASKKDMCVKEIAIAVGISQSLASHQLANLSAYEVIEGHRMGHTMCYVPAKNVFAKKLFKVIKIL